MEDSNLSIKTDANQKMDRRHSSHEMNNSSVNVKQMAKLFQEQLLPQAATKFNNQLVSNSSKKGDVCINANHNNNNNNNNVNNNQTSVCRREVISRREEEAKDGINSEKNQKRCSFPSSSNSNNLLHPGLTLSPPPSGSASDKDAAHNLKCNSSFDISRRDMDTDKNDDERHKFSASVSNLIKDHEWLSQVVNESKLESFFNDDDEEGNVYMVPDGDGAKFESDAKNVPDADRDDDDYEVPINNNLDGRAFSLSKISSSIKLPRRKSKMDGVSSASPSKHDKMSASMFNFGKLTIGKKNTLKRFLSKDANKLASPSFVSHTKDVLLDANTTPINKLSSAQSFNHAKRELPSIPTTDSNHDKMRRSLPSLSVNQISSNVKSMEGTPSAKSLSFNSNNCLSSNNNVHNDKIDQQITDAIHGAICEDVYYDISFDGDANFCEEDENEEEIYEELSSSDGYYDSMVPLSTASSCSADNRNAYQDYRRDKEEIRETLNEEEDAEEGYYEDIPGYSGSNCSDIYETLPADKIDTNEDNVSVCKDDVCNDKVDIDKFKNELSDKLIKRSSTSSSSSDNNFRRTSTEYVQIDTTDKNGVRQLIKLKSSSKDPDAKDGRDKIKSIDKKSIEINKKREIEAIKLKYKFNLTGNEVPLNYGIVKEDVNWMSRKVALRSNSCSKYMLKVKKGETVLILRMEGNPPGLWLAKNESSNIGYVDLSNLTFDPESVKILMKVGNEIIAGDNHDQ